MKGAIVALVAVLVLWSATVGAGLKKPQKLKLETDLSIPILKKRYRAVILSPGYWVCCSLIDSGLRLLYYSNGHNEGGVLFNEKSPVWSRVSFHPLIIKNCLYVGKELDLEKSKPKDTFVSLEYRNGTTLLWRFFTNLGHIQRKYKHLLHAAHDEDFVQSHDAYDIFIIGSASFRVGIEVDEIPEALLPNTTAPPQTTAPTTTTPPPTTTTTTTTPPSSGAASSGSDSSEASCSGSDETTTIPPSAGVIEQIMLKAPGGPEYK